ncbi:MAG: TolC family protein, partial [Acidobacteria bacterium]|nr:TolC family protein [Acidobacteriota bacterium]
KKEYWPNVTLGAGMINVGGRDDPAGLVMPPSGNSKNAFNFSIGINIPIRRDKYSAGVLEATEGLIANRKQYLNIRNEMEYSIRDQAIRIETLQEQVELFGQVLIPQAEEALRSTESAYETGQLGALDLLDSERVLWELRLINARYDADYLQALANLERAVGTKFPR